MGCQTEGRFSQSVIEMKTNTLEDEKSRQWAYFHTQIFMGKTDYDFIIQMWNGIVILVRILKLNPLYFVVHLYFLLTLGSPGKKSCTPFHVYNGTLWIVSFHLHQHLCLVSTPCCTRCYLPDFQLSHVILNPTFGGPVHLSFGMTPIFG